MVEDPVEETLVGAWPLWGLRLTHGDLELRVVRDADAVALGRIIHTVLPEDTAHHLPNLTVNAIAPTEEETVRRSLQYQWSLRASVSPSSWALPFAVVESGRVVGSQDLRAESFATLREVDTGSYLVADARGRGIGTRMRAMVLELAFAHLGALSATSSHVEGNDASRRVSLRCGYEPDGVRLVEFRGRRLIDHRLRLDAARWADVRPAWLDEAAVDGVDAVLPLLGAGVS